MPENQAVFTVYPLQRDLWQIHEEGAGQSVDCYLIVGTERAALVDSLMSRGDRRLYDIVREKTDLPLLVLHTHGHGDHVGAELREFIDAGCEVYLSDKDRPIMGGFGARYPAEIFRPLTDGQRFSLGGCTLEVFEIPGHTPGSVAFLDREHGRLFSGDTIGSGNFWMQLRHSVPLAELLEGVEKLEAQTAGLPGLLIYPGHRSQSPVQLTEAYIADLRSVLEDILSGKAAGTPFEPASPMMAEHTLSIGRGLLVEMLYDGDRIR